MTISDDDNKSADSDAKSALMTWHVPRVELLSSKTTEAPKTDITSSEVTINKGPS